MKDVVTLYAQPYNPARPTICFDEQPVQLLAEARPLRPLTPGYPRRVMFLNNHAMSELVRDRHARFQAEARAGYDAGSAGGNRNFSIRRWLELLLKTTGSRLPEAGSFAEEGDYESEGTLQENAHQTQVGRGWPQEAK